MKPLDSYKPHATDPESVRLITAVHSALNDIDRSMYKPLEPLPDRYGELTDAYDRVHRRFQVEAESLDLADFLEFTVASRKFGLMRDDLDLDHARRLFEQMESCGWPDVTSLVCIPMIWANRLAEEDRIEEARAVASRLVADVDAFCEQYPNVLIQGFHDDFNRFRQRVGV